MKTILKTLCLLSLTFSTLAGQWSITLQNRETEEIPVLYPTTRDYYIPERSNGEWQCVLKKEEMIFDYQGLPLLGRVLACATKDGEFIGGKVVCEKLEFENETALLMPEPCVDELELKDLGGSVPNIRIQIKYEWWK